MPPPAHPPIHEPDGEPAALLDRACTAGELTTATSRELVGLALRTCELELENASLKGKLAALTYGCADGTHYGFAQLVAIELAAARQLWPRIVTSHEAAAIIREEFDEFWDLVRLRPGARDPRRLLKELIQTAAMCQRAAEDLHLLERASRTPGPGARDAVVGAAESSLAERIPIVHPGAAPLEEPT